MTTPIRPPRQSAAPRPTPPAPATRPTSPAFVIGVVFAGLAAGLAVVYFVLPRWLTTPDAAQTSATRTTAPASADAKRSSATLYFVNDDGTSLVAAARDIPIGASPAEQARNIVTAVLAPAPAGFVSAIPSGVKLRGFFLTPRGDAYVDLSREIITGHPGGSLNEALTVYALVNALTENVKEVTGVQILVDGQQVDTLAGHLDLRQPLAAGPRWVQKGP